MSEKCYPELYSIIVFTLIFLLSLFWLYTILGNYPIYPLFLCINILYFIIFLFPFWGRNVIKVVWDDREIIFYRWYFKKYRYRWDDIDGVYYCPKIGYVHMIISTEDGEYYSLPNISNKLYKAIEKYAKVKITMIRHPMEILPSLRERRKKMRALRKQIKKELSNKATKDEIG